MAPPQSRAGFQAEIELISGGRSVKIPAQNFLQALEVESSANGTWTGNLVLYDKGGLFLEDLLIVAGTDRIVRMRFNWEEFGLENAPLMQGLVIVPNHVFLPDGIILTLEMIAQPVAVAVADKKTRSFAPGQTISAMVSSIVSERGWPTTDRFGNGTIEATVGDMTEPFSTVDESDVKFIKSQLRKHAVNADGVSGFLFYFDTEGVVHFHSQNYLRPRKRTYRYARDGNGEILLFTPSETSYLAQIEGAGNAVFRSSASKSATQTAQDATASSGVEGTVDETVSDSTAIPDAGDGTAAIIPITARDADELARVAKDRRAQLKRFHITAELEVLGTHDLRVLDYIEVLYLKADGAEHYLSGTYLIQKFKHRLDNTGWRTIFTLSREGLQPQPGTVARSGGRVIQPQEIA